MIFTEFQLIILYISGSIRTYSIKQSNFRLISYLMFLSSPPYVSLNISKIVVYSIYLYIRTNVVNSFHIAFVIIIIKVYKIFIVACESSSTIPIVSVVFFIIYSSFHTKPRSIKLRIFSFYKLTTRSMTCAFMSCKLSFYYILFSATLNALAFCHFLIMLIIVKSKYLKIIYNVANIIKVFSSQLLTPPLL